jgi:CMP-N,N'-diacetyllegionaminic acid synthase
MTEKQIRASRGRRSSGTGEQAEVLALIPARSGSKSVPDKNIRQFRGIPLLAHSIRHAQMSSLITRTIVSTDSVHYAKIARKFGAEVPFLRPAELAGDLSTDLEVFEHALGWLEREENYRPEICVHLRPTYPTRNAADIDSIVRLLLNAPDLDSVRSVTVAADTPFKMWFRDESGMLQAVLKSETEEAHSAPRQSLPTVYVQNACVDAIRCNVIRSQRSMTGVRVYGYVIDHNDDIDTEADFEKALLKGHLAGDNSDDAIQVSRRVICVDIDGVLATVVPTLQYQEAQPIRYAIEIVNALYRAGHEIVLFTARGSATGMDWQALTERQLRSWGVQYHRLMFGKPAADYYVDDKAVLPDGLLNLLEDLSVGVSSGPSS